MVAEFVNQHSNQTDVTRQPKETLAKAKEMQNSDFHLSSLKTEANQKAYENLQKGQKRDVKVRFDYILLGVFRLTVIPSGHWISNQKIFGWLVSKNLQLQ